MSSKTYPLPESSLLRGPSGFVPASPMPGYESRVMRQRQRQSTDLAAIIGQILSESEGHILTAKLHVRQVNQLNARIIRVLAATTGKNLGEGPGSLEEMVGRGARLHLRPAPAPSPAGPDSLGLQADVRFGSPPRLLRGRHAGPLTHRPPADRAG